MNISNLDICCLAYEKQFEQVKERIEKEPDLVKKKDRDGRTVFHWACSSGATDIVEYLLNVCHVRPDIPDEVNNETRIEFKHFRFVFLARLDTFDNRGFNRTH